MLKQGDFKAMVQLITAIFKKQDNLKQKIQFNYDGI